MKLIGDSNSVTILPIARGIPRTWPEYRRARLVDRGTRRRDARRVLVGVCGMSNHPGSPLDRKVVAMGSCRGRQPHRNR